MSADAIYAEMLAQLQRLNSSIEEATRIAADATVRIEEQRQRIVQLESDNATLQGNIRQLIQGRVGLASC